MSALSSSSLLSVGSVPGASSGGGDPFGGATAFGFSIPQGDVGALESAAAKSAGASLGFGSRAEDVSSAVGTASAGWAGSAESEFAGYAGHLSSVLSSNSEVLGRASEALSRFARELEQAQQVTRQAATQCEQYQGELGTQQGLAQEHGGNAQTLYAQASLAAHPQMQGDLVKQAKAEEGLAHQAAQAAAQAQREFDFWQKRGRDAYTAYTEQAGAVRGQISGLTGELRPPQIIGGGGAPVPITVTPTDMNFARALMPAISALPASAWAEDPGGRLAALNDGQALTPAQVLAVYDVAKEEQSNGQGSLIDAAGGFAHTASLGLVSFGNPNTARYRGGEDAAMIPIDPDSLVVDADRTAVTAVSDTASRLDYSRGFDTDLENFAPGTASVHTGPLDGDLTLVQYYDGGGGGSYKWWTSTHDANDMPTVPDVMNQLALEPKWGERNAVAVARVPEGTDVTIIHGEAAPQETTPGGAIQYRFKDFDERWIVKKRPLP